jgi:hypothetical protein
MLLLAIEKASLQAYKEYELTSCILKMVTDLTTDFAVDWPGREIVSAQFLVFQNPRTVDKFYKDCTNILNNIHISYSCKD